MRHSVCLLESWHALSFIANRHYIIEASCHIKCYQTYSGTGRQPITATVLDKMCSMLLNGYLTAYMGCLLIAACLIAFFGCLWCGEFKVTDNDFESSFNLCFGDVTFHNSHAELLLKSAKMDPF